MAWIESHQSVSGHPKTKRAARQLKVSIPTMVGHLHLLWHWALEYAQEGDLSKYDELDIADAAQWEGDPEQFVNALVNAGPGNEPGFLEPNGEYGPPDNPRIGELVIRDWWDYAGKLIAKRQADAERKRQARSETSTNTPKDVPKTSGGRPSDGAGNRTLTVPNRTEERTDAPKKSAPGDGMPKPIDVVEVWCDEMDTDLHVVSPQFKNQQCGVAKELLERGYGPDVVRKRIRFLRSQGWRDEPPDLRQVLKGIDAWFADGAKERAKSKRKSLPGDEPLDPDRHLKGEFAAIFNRRQDEETTL